jgi:hypothetical protein
MNLGVQSLAAEVMEKPAAQRSLARAGARVVTSKLVRAPRSLESLPFKDQRLLLSTLRVTARADGDDPARWRLELTL